MARLRRPSLSDPDNDLPANPPASAAAKPKKTNVRDLRYTADTFLVPKTPANETPGRKQRTLRPLAHNTTLLHKLSVDDLSSPEKTPRRRREDGLGALYSRSLAKTVARRRERRGEVDKKIAVAADITEFTQTEFTQTELTQTEDDMQESLQAEPECEDDIQQALQADTEFDDLIGGMKGLAVDDGLGETKVEDQDAALVEDADPDESLVCGSDGESGDEVPEVDEESPEDEDESADESQSEVNDRRRSRPQPAGEDKRRHSGQLQEDEDTDSEEEGEDEDDVQFDEDESEDDDFDEEDSDSEDSIIDVKNRRRQLLSKTPSAPPAPSFRKPEKPQPARPAKPAWSSSEVIDLTSSPPRALAPPVRSESRQDSSRPTSSYSTDGNTNAILSYLPPPPQFRSPRKAPPIARPQTPPPAPQSPKKLVSPSKKKATVPAHPKLRPSIDAFWDAQVVNDWADQHSPPKKLVSPRKQKLLASLEQANYDSDNSLSSPTTSPRKNTGKTPAKKAITSPSVIQLRAAAKAFAASKHSIATSFLQELDQTITSGEISRLSASTGGIKIVWSRTLKTTAGRANWRRETIRLRTGPGPTDLRTEYRHHCSIELAEKVIDDESRLHNVLAHEFCHLTTFMISNQRSNPHGAEFKEWARKVSGVYGDSHGVEVTTKHSYAISYKYVWECVECGYEFKRHSKSVDPVRHSCGRCKGRLVQTKPVPRAGGAATKDGNGGKSEYQIFVKENFSRVKKELESQGLDASMGSVTQALGREYRERKARKEEQEKNRVGELDLALGALSLGGRV